MTNKPTGPIEPEDPAEPPDNLLMARAGAGDRDAFAALFRRHHALVYRFARQMTGSREMAEDVTQDVFVALGSGAARYDPTRGALTTYLYGIARNLVARQHRRGRAGRDVEIDAMANEAPAALTTSQDPVGDLARAEMRRAVRRAILLLPARYREVIVLCELNGVSYEDAARIVGCPIGTIRSRLNRGRNMLIGKCRAILTDRPAPREGSRCLTETTNES